MRRNTRPGSRNYRFDYEANKQVIQTRENQPKPSSPYRGNYRVNEQGEPIIPTNIGNNQEEYDIDYFDKRSQKASSQSDNVYNIHDYYSQANEFSNRMRQPNNRPYAQPVGYREDFKQHRSNSNMRARRNQRVDNMPPRKNWYYQLHDWINGQLIKSNSNATLPKGKASLFAVFSLIYLTMLVSGWNLLPFNKINNLVVTGNEIVPSEFVANSSKIYTYDEIGYVTSQKQIIEQKIKEENPIVESVTFNRPNWRQFELNIREHEVVALINVDGETHSVLSNGDMLNIDTNPMLSNIASDSVPILIGFNTSGQVLDLAKGLRQIDPTILAMMDMIYYTEDPNKPNAIEVDMKDGNLIKAIVSTFSQKVQHYPEILTQLDGRKGIINFEVGAYFTPNVSNANSIKLDNN